MKNRMLFGAVALISTVALGGCGLIPPGTGGSGDKKVTIWLMKDSVTADFLGRFKKSYEEEHASVELEFKIQEWGGIGPKVMDALAGEDTPRRHRGRQHPGRPVRGERQPARPDPGIHA